MRKKLRSDWRCWRLPTVDVIVKAATNLLLVDGLCRHGLVILAPAQMEIIASNFRLANILRGLNRSTGSYPSRMTYKGFQAVLKFVGDVGNVLFRQVG